MGTPVNPMQPYENYGEKELFSYLKNATINKDGKSNYSNLGAGLAGVLAERITGSSYEQLLKKYITNPFNLKYSQLNAATNRAKSIGYFDNAIATYWNMNSLKAAGGIKSDATDMLAYIEYLLQNNQSPVIQNITKPTLSINKRLQIAKGWHILSLPNNTSLYWHNGGTYGFSTFCAFHKETGKGIFIAVNAFNKNNN
jgi:CubicO group peptidase (beta-lactamase class C family)